MLSLSGTVRIFLCAKPPISASRSTVSALSSARHWATILFPATGSSSATARVIGSKSWPGKRTDGACGINGSKRESFASLLPLARGRAASKSALRSWPCSWTASSWRRCNVASAITARPRPSDPCSDTPRASVWRPVSLLRSASPSLSLCHDSRLSPQVASPR